MQRTLGIDFGQARIGLALSDELGWMAHPFQTLHDQGSLAKNIASLLEIIATKNVGTIVIGLPRNMDGSEGASAQKVREFAQELQTKTTLPLHFWDERLSTVAATKALHASGKKAKEHRKMIDQVAAQQILQGWLDGRLNS